MATNEDTGRCDRFHYDHGSVVKIGEHMAAAFATLAGGVRAGEQAPGGD